MFENKKSLTIVKSDFFFVTQKSVHFKAEIGMCWASENTNFLKEFSGLNLFIKRYEASEKMKIFLSYLCTLNANNNRNN